MSAVERQLPAEQTDEREPESTGWLASLGHVNSRPRYPKRSLDQVLLAMGARSDACVGGLGWMIVVSIWSIASFKVLVRDLMANRARSRGGDSAGDDVVGTSLLLLGGPSYFRVHS